MTFLIMDTGGAMCVLALAEEATGAVQAVSVFEGRRTLSRRLFGEVDALLGRHGLTVDDLTAFAVGLGPGSFTGVRVGVTTAKTLAQVTGKPLVGVGTLDAYAAVWEGEAMTVVPVLPSRRGEVYAAVYRGGVSADGPFAASYADLRERLDGLDRVVVCGEPAQLPDWDGPALAQPWTPPEGLARIAVRRLSSGEKDDPLALVPLYVVPPAISTPKSPSPTPSLEGRGRESRPEGERPR